MTRTDWWMLVFCVIWVGFLASVTQPSEEVIAALNSLATANWVQAIGSVVAILVAIWVAAWQNDRARDARAAEERASRRKALETVQMLALKATNMIESAANATADPQADAYQDYLVLGFNAEVFEDMRGTLERIALHELPDPDAAIALHSLRRAFIETEKEMSELRRTNDRHPFLPPAPVKKQNDRAQLAYGEIEKAVRRTDVVA